MNNSSHNKLLNLIKLIKQYISFDSIMNKENVHFIETLCRELSENEVKYRHIDQRWKKRGDVDIIVAKDSLKTFEATLKKSGFIRKGFWPPQSRTYETFVNNERIPIGGHIGGFIGAFGGGMGKLGKKFSPRTVKRYEDSYLSKEEQIFILLYKYESRNHAKKYEEYYNNLLNNKIDYNKLLRLLSFTFSNPKSLIAQIKNKQLLNETKINFKLKIKKSLKSKGKFNRILRTSYKTVFPSPYIAFVGCNGTGKSTAIETLTQKLTNQKIKVGGIYSGRFHFQILKPVNKILKYFKPNKIERGENHHKGTKRVNMREVRIYNSRILRFLTPFVYYIEYFFRYFFKVYPLRIKKDIVITDRSFLDIFNSPNTNKFVCKILFKLMPKPKHILLWNDPEELLERRPEFLLKHIKNQLKVYDQFSSLYFMKVKTDKLEVVDEIAEKVQKLI
jgi:hypothetical protein